MIDLDRLESRCKEASRNGYGKHPVIECASAESIMELITRLRQAEKDAARYRWIKANSQLGVGRCGVDWELHFKGLAPDNSAKVERHIDEAMQCSK